MKYCKKCGNEVSDNIKFCPKCGERINSNNAPNNIVNKKRKIGLKIALISAILILILIFSVSVGVTYIKQNASHKDNATKNMEILNVDIDKYPEVTASIKINNYENKINVKNITIKENDAFQKDLKLSDGVNDNEYTISYKTSDESTSSEKNIKIACTLDNDEVTSEYSYTPPEKKQTVDKKSNSSNSVNTYDNNEIKVKNSIEDYESAYIRMINSKNIDYIKGSIDLSGGLISEFTSLIKNYSEQQIEEELVSHKIEDIKKISNSEYQVTVYEKYYISYGKNKTSSYTDFRDTYVVRSTASDFKVYSIKDVVQISSKTNP
ncbi:zinc ribbon domain-containing protein [Clostridium sp. YIM B02500]|uniref:zinc ribbon domain-containing protein n=1 Tax=Clostridium sp. YIM B02500 TaxID=2910681 RepID=UPI001EED7AC0|nr:zinc ribbon domain-containing protein [Clostridium sp. YIM B02500]